MGLQILYVTHEKLMSVGDSVSGPRYSRVPGVHILFVPPARQLSPDESTQVWVLKSVYNFQTSARGLLHVGEKAAEPKSHGKE